MQKLQEQKHEVHVELTIKANWTHDKYQIKRRPLLIYNSRQRGFLTVARIQQKQGTRKIGLNRLVNTRNNTETYSV